jgi:hypothetical protein
VRTRIVIAAWFAVALLVAQQEGARELFYIAAVKKKEPLPPIRKKTATTPGAAAAAPPAVSNLGLRYNLVLVDPATNRMTPVDSDQNFRNGQCVAIQIEANRSGYLYVLSRETNGNWQPLLPSAEMPNESNTAHPGEKMRIPERHCFEIEDPPGTDTLFVVLSRDPADIYELNEGIKGRTPAAQSPIQLAGLVNKEVDRFNRDLREDDFVKLKVAKPLTASETPNSVYVVNKSPKPASRVVTEIQIRHR